MAIFLKEEFLKKFKAWKATTLIVQPLIQVLYLQVTETGVRAAVVLLVEERISQPLCPRQYLNEKRRFFCKEETCKLPVYLIRKHFIVEQEVSLILSVLIFVDFDIYQILLCV